LIVHQRRPESLLTHTHACCVVRRGVLGEDDCGACVCVCVP
jgi:hypothetical protein